jgi:hypothetical protein
MPGLPLAKRGILDSQTYGPIFVLGIQDRFCPMDPEGDDSACGTAGDDDGVPDPSGDDPDSDSRRKRENLAGNTTPNLNSSHHLFERAKKEGYFCTSLASPLTMPSPLFNSAGEQIRLHDKTPIYGPNNPSDCKFILPCS